MSTPYSWKTRVDVAVQAAQQARSPASGHPKMIVSFRSSAAGMIREAALARGLTVSGFTRRATLAFTASVLELPYLDVVAVDPTIQLSGDFSPAPDPSGRIGGPWEILALR